MKTKKPVLKPLLLVASAMLWCALNLPAQTAPTITTQPANQTAVAGANVTLTVAVAGTGPFTYQWQYNGSNLPNNIITTVAGNGGTGTNAGDGGPATNASFFDPTGVAVDAFGNLYVADVHNNRIRKVDTNGIITTVAGRGESGTLGGYSGDGGAATNADLSCPDNVRFDAWGNLYIADGRNNRIRKLGTNGIITTVAGGGSGGDGGPAINASLNLPLGLALDNAGNLYIADCYNQRIRMVGANGVISTVAGTKSAGYSGDGGAATNARLSYPSGVAVDGFDNLYIADWRNNSIRKVDTNGIITTVAYRGDGGPAASPALVLPSDVVLDTSGNLYVADFGNYRIRKVDTNGIITTLAGNGNGGYSGDGGAATNASLYGPNSVALDASGNQYIADSDNNRIRKVQLAGYPTVAMTNVSATNAGSYTVIITSPYGSVTSAVATLTVQAPPAFTLDLTNQTVLAGSTPAFSVVVVGSGPFGYYWYFAGTNLVQSGTNSMLLLSSVLTNNSGNYTVVVTNSYGSVTSAVAALTVTIPKTPPQIMAGDGSFGILTNQFGFDISGAFGQTIVVDGSTDLVNWTPVCTNTVGGGPYYFCDPCWTNYPWRFYRARLP